MNRAAIALWGALLGVFLVFSNVENIAAQDAPAPAPAPAADEESSTPAPAANNRNGGPKAYDQVITGDARTDEGIFKVHRIRDRVYYEIPETLLGKDFLLVSQIARTTAGSGFGGDPVGSRVVRWERVNNRILLRNVSYSLVADEDSPIAKAVAAANNNTILMPFNIEAEGPNNAAVIDVTRLFSTDVPEISARARLRARGLDANRSFIEQAVSFEENIEIEATHTYTTPPDAAPAGGAPAASSATVVMHFSMVKLPENPMTPRLFDERVGFFNITQRDFSQDEHRAAQRRYINRWRLEKKDPSAQLSEPVKPIVYWVDPATPTKWVEYIKKGIEAWQPAFEEAGFKNAIIAKEAPSAEQDPDWSPEDARNSVVRWLPSAVENAFGPHIADPRTGEILDADIQLHHNIMNLLRNWYFVQVSPLDPRAQKLPLPDDLMGELLAHVVTHEVGHTLGLEHNMKASSTYPAASIRDAEWVSKMGHTPTLMDYSRFNYVAQPEDNIAPEHLIPRIGPYDKWAIVWGYKPIPAAKTADEEKSTLDEWARQQESNPHLRFSTVDSRGTDPGDLTEAVGDADAVTSSTLGMKNLERVGQILLSATSRPGENYDDLQQIYERLLGQWVLEMNHVVALIGGSDAQEKFSNQEGVRFASVPKDRQIAAVKFLLDNAFKVPSFANRPEILRRIEPAGVLDRVRTAQQRVLSGMLSNARIARLVEQETMDGVQAYRPTDFLTEVRRGIWSELSAAQVKIDAFRRNLQRSYFDILVQKLGPQSAGDDARAFARGELRALNTAVVAALAKTTDRPTRLHLEDIRDQVRVALEPNFVPRPAAPLPAFGDDDITDPYACFPDYSIRAE